MSLMHCWRLVLVSSQSWRSRQPNTLSDEGEKLCIPRAVRIMHVGPKLDLNHHLAAWLLVSLRCSVRLSSWWSNLWLSPFLDKALCSPITRPVSGQVYHMYVAETCRLSQNLCIMRISWRSAFCFVLTLEFFSREICSHCRSYPRVELASNAKWCWVHVLHKSALRHKQLWPLDPINLWSRLEFGVFPIHVGVLDIAVFLALSLLLFLDNVSLLGRNTYHLVPCWVPL